MEKEIKELMKEFEYMLEEEPEKVMEFTKHLYKHNPEAVRKMLLTFDDNGHIRDRQTYDKIVDCLEWSNKQGYGEKWTVDKIKSSAGINFDETDFSEFDYAYLVNFLYAKCCKYTQDAYVFLKIARGLLEDKHKQVKLNKGGFQQKHKYQGRGEQSYYDLFFDSDYNRHSNNENRRGRYENENYRNDYNNRSYDEDNRRGRYRSEDGEMENENRRGRRSYRSEDDYENRNDYNRYYKESNMGFTR